MADQQATTVKYPLLEALLAAKGLPLRGVYTVAHIAQIFDIGNRAIYDWFRDEKLASRDLPGRGRCLSEDLEEFLRKSLRKPLNGRGAQK